MKAVFPKMDDYAFKLGSEKCEFFMKQIRYFGQIFDEKVRRPDRERTESIRSMPSRNNVTNLQALLSLANNYSVYIPKMYDLKALLNNELKKNRKWTWSKECKPTFQKIKRYLSKDLSFTHFDPKKEVIVASNESSNSSKL